MSLCTRTQKRERPSLLGTFPWINLFFRATGMLTCVPVGILASFGGHQSECLGRGW